MMGTKRSQRRALCATKLSQPILNAIESAVKAGTGLAELPDVIRAAYIADAQELLARGVPESAIINRFKEIANGLGSFAGFDLTFSELGADVQLARPGCR